MMHFFSIVPMLIFPVTYQSSQTPILLLRGPREFFPLYYEATRGRRKGLFVFLATAQIYSMRVDSNPYCEVKVKTFFVFNTEHMVDYRVQLSAQWK